MAEAVHLIAVRDIRVITALEPVARDFDTLLRDPRNADIAAEFPESVARYSGPPEQVAQNLRAAREDCRLESRHQFIAFAGRRAVGMSAVHLVDRVPEGIDPAWPNLSGFVCNPYRNQGIGRLSLLARLRVVREQFGGRAWTKVKNGNVCSQRMVEHAGFTVAGEDNASLVYAYDASRA